MALLSPKKHFSNLIAGNRGKVTYVDPSTFKAITEKKYEKYGVAEAKKSDSKVVKK